MKLAIALFAITSDFWRGLTEEARCISPYNVQVSVAGSLGVFQVFAQLPDRFGISTRFVVVVRVTQIADEQLQLRIVFGMPLGGLTKQFATEQLQFLGKLRDRLLLRLNRFDQYLIERLSEFLTKMAQTPDPLAEGSLLDNTIVLHGCGTCKTHVGRNFPLVLAGGKNLGLKHGAFHRFEQERPFNALLLTLLQRVGVETESFGDGEGMVDQILV